MAVTSWIQAPIPSGGSGGPVPAAPPPGGPARALGKGPGKGSGRKRRRFVAHPDPGARPGFYAATWPLARR